MRWMLVALLCLPGAGLADVSGPGGRVIECYCTDSTGGRVELDQEICLTVGGRAFIARCEMSLNTPMWRDTGRPCLGSALGGLQRLEPAGDAGGVHPQIAVAEHEV
jgi:hypothetical protein